VFVLITGIDWGGLKLFLEFEEFLPHPQPILSCSFH
jgi:hypothetical protein